MPIHGAPFSPSPIDLLFWGSRLMRRLKSRDFFLPKWGMFAIHDFYNNLSFFESRRKLWWSWYLRKSHFIPNDQAIKCCSRMKQMLRNMRKLKQPSNKVKACPIIIDSMVFSSVNNTITIRFLLITRGFWRCPKMIWSSFETHESSIVGRLASNKFASFTPVVCYRSIGLTFRLIKSDFWIDHYDANPVRNGLRGTPQTNPEDVPIFKRKATRSDLIQRNIIFKFRYMVASGS